MYVIRYSLNIQADILRGWSAWMGLRESSLELLVENTPKDEEEFENAWTRWPNDDYEAFLLDYCERKGWRATEDPYAPASARWCWWHHDGLACYLLNSESLEDAIEEGRRVASVRAIPTGQGWMTEGTVKVVADLGNNWYLLECDDVSPEV